MDERDLVNAALEVRSDIMAELLGQFGYSLVETFNLFLYKLDALVQTEVLSI